MPIYEYYCKHCDKTTEKLFSMSGFKDKIKCECGDNAVKIISKSFMKVPNPVSEARRGRGTK